jgi:type 1 glutamine amidotransferase
MAISIAFILALPTAARSAAALDCPHRDQHYSSRSPLIDLLLKPEAVVAIEHNAPSLMSGLSPDAKRLTVPTFAPIFTLRNVAGASALSEEAWSKLDRDLAALTITARDKQARCARYDNDVTTVAPPTVHPAILVFEKMTGWLDEPSKVAAHTALFTIAKENGWAIAATDRAGAITADNLRHYDVVVWNNVSGDALTVAQRRVFKSYIERGGGFVGLHGAGGDPNYFWDWYVDTLIGTRFIGHPMQPQFQTASIKVADPSSPMVRDLMPGWIMKDEWYSFRPNPRVSGSHVLLALDETTYWPQWGGKDLRMGDHPIAWTRCVNNGRSFFSAIGHRPEGYSEPRYKQALKAGLAWAADAGDTECRRGREVARTPRALADAN